MSKMDRVAQALHEIIAGALDEDVGDLDEAMQEMAKVQRSLDGLRAVPGFRKLWDAMAEAVDQRSMDCGKAGR